MSKKFLALILVLGTVLIFGAAVSADAGYAADDEICGKLGLVGDGDAASWSVAQAASRSPVGENLVAMGVYSPFLDKATGGAGSTYVQFAPKAGTTVSDLNDLAAGKFGFWYFLSAGEGPQLELRFEDPDSSAVVDITIMAAQGTHATTGSWTEVNVTSTTVSVMSAGTGPNDEELWYIEGGGLTLADVLTQLEAQSLSWTADDWVLTRVRLELWEAGARTCYVDDVNIWNENDEFHVYDLEPCGITLYPPIAKNVKTAMETFTVVDGDGFEIDGATVFNWIVARGQGTGDVITHAGGALTADNNFITVYMVDIGDATITCDVDYDDNDPHVKEVTLDAEKKWGEIYFTELTAWEPTPCLDPDMPHPRSGIDVNEEVLVQEKVIANFLPGPVPAPAGGAKITWWLLENDAEGEAQLALEDLIQKFDRCSDFVSGPLGYGDGCGQYAEWATPPDVDFIPEDMIEVIYAAHPALHTNFVAEECTTVGPRTTTVTFTDHVGDPLGEGFTNTTVRFSEVDGTGEVEPVIVVVLADYPSDKNGQNAVCVEYFKFTPEEFLEYKDVQTLVVDVLDPVTQAIDPIRKMLYVFVRDYDGTPANPESVEFFIDGPYGLFDELLADTDVDPSPEPGCYPDQPGDAPAYPAGIFNGGKSATSTTRLAYADEKVTGHFDGVVTGTGIGEFKDDPLDLGYIALPGAHPFNNPTAEDGYAIAGVRIISSFKKCVDILIKVHDCHGCADHVIIIRDVMVCFGAPDSATRTYYSVGVGGWYMVSTPFDPLADPSTVASVYYDYDELPGVILYQWDPSLPTPDYVGRSGTYVVNSKWGWWLYLAGDVTVTVEGTDPPVGDTTNFDSADFGANGWYQISAPYTAAWDDTTTPGIETTGGKARIVSYDPETATYLNHYVGDEYVLSPWYSYWVKVENKATAAFELEKAIPSIMPSPLSTMSAQRTLAGLDMPPAPPSFVPEGAVPEVKVELAAADGVVTFAASAGEALKVQVFNLSGGLVYEASADGSELTWAMQTAAGELVANGIYLAKVGVKTAAGWVNGGLFRILVLR